MISDSAVAASTRILDRRTPLLGLIGIALILALAIGRELFAPSVRWIDDGADLIGPSSGPPTLLRPLIMLAHVFTQLIALTLVVRFLEVRRVRVVPVVLASLFVCILIAILKHLLDGTHTLRHTLIAGPLSGLQVYALWVLAFRYPQLVDAAHFKSLEAARLRQESELARLREHLQPHFLRNTLNAIAALTTEAPHEARNVLAALADLLSDSLEHPAHTQTLGDELAWIRRYAEIFEARYRGALRFDWQLDPEAERCALPRLLLQPLVENAIRHGALAREGAGEVFVSTRARPAGGAIVEVRDNGPGFDPASVRTQGLGLRLVRRRLELECSTAALRIASSSAGTRVTVELA